MPNWVTIEMRCKGSKADIKRLVEAVASEEEGALDFNKIIPQPEGLLLGNVSVVLQGEKLPPEQQASKDKTGYASWYDFNRECWGTKWNASSTNVDVRDGSATYRFQTAWSLPEPIFERLSKMFPTVKLTVRCVEEGGFFCGKQVYQNGLINDQITESSSSWKYYARTLYSR